MGALKLEDLPRYTYSDYVNWEDRWELIYGVAYAMAPAPMIRHQSVSNNIACELNNSLRNCKRCKALLPVDWKISDETIVQPDNSVICHINGKYIKVCDASDEIVSFEIEQYDEKITFDFGLIW